MINKFVTTQVSDKPLHYELNVTKNATLAKMEPPSNSKYMQHRKAMLLRVFLLHVCT